MEKERLAAEVKLVASVRSLAEAVGMNFKGRITIFGSEYVGFDRPRVIRILERVAADLDQLTQCKQTEWKVML